MNVEERTKDAITITRGVLKKALTSPFTMIAISAEDLDPEVLQDTVYTILCYLEKTRPEKPEEAEAAR